MTPKIYTAGIAGGLTGIGVYNLLLVIRYLSGVRKPLYKSPLGLSILILLDMIIGYVLTIVLCRLLGFALIYSITYILI
jgi:hypothetical protein